MNSRWKVSLIKFLTAFLIVASIPITPNNYAEAKNNAKAETVICSPLGRQMKKIKSVYRMGSFYVKKINFTRY